MTAGYFNKRRLSLIRVPTETGKPGNPGKCNGHGKSWNITNWQKEFCE